MKNEFLDCGRIVNTHGIRGEVKIQPWADSPEFLCGFDTLYVNGAPVKVLSAFAHKGNCIAALDGVSDVNAAMLLKGRVVSIARKDAKLPAGRYFLADLMGLEVRDADNGTVLGSLSDILTPPANNVYVVTGGDKEYMIPAVDEFIVETNVDDGFIRVHLLEGMEQDV